MEESVAWDRRLAEKQQNRDEAGFAGTPRHYRILICQIIHRLQKNRIDRS